MRRVPKIYWERLRPIDLVVLSRMPMMDGARQFHALLGILDNLVSGGVSTRPIGQVGLILERFGREAPVEIPRILQTLAPQPPQITLPASLAGLAAHTVQPRVEAGSQN